MLFKVKTSGKSESYYSLLGQNQPKLCFRESLGNKSLDTVLLSYGGYVNMPFMTHLRLLDEIYRSGYQMIKFVHILDDIDCPNENFNFCHNYKPIARWTWYVKLDWSLVSLNVTGIVLITWSLGQLTLILETKESTTNEFCRSKPTVN